MLKNIVHLGKAPSLIKCCIVLAKSNLLLILSSVSYVIFTLYPYRGWLRFSDFTKAPFPDVDIYKDSLYYLGQLREILNGNYFLGNPLIYEHSRDGFSYGNSSLFYIWGSLGSLLNLELMSLYLLMVSINSFLMVIVLAKFFQIFYDSKSSAIFALLVSLFFIGPLGRPSPTQQLLPILIFGLKLIFTDNKKNKIFTSIQFIVSMTILVTGNPYYGLFLLIVSVVTKLIFQKKYKSYIFESIFLSLVYFVWTRYEFDAQDQLIAARLGLHYSRIPGAIKITIPILMLLLIFLIVQIRSLGIKNRLSVATMIKIKKNNLLLFALLIAVNSQVLTGISLEMESHFKLIWNVLCGLSILNLCLIILEIFRLSPLIYLGNNLIHIILILGVLIYLVPQFEVVKVKDTTQSRVFENIKSDKNIKTILIKDSSETYELRNQFIYLTDVYLYWGKGAEFSKISDTEISRRFTCTQTKILSESEFLDSFFASPPRNLINMNQKEERWRKFLNKLGLESSMKNELMQTYSYTLVDYKTYLEHVSECSTENLKFRADKILY